ncbi:MAG TPA: hypothetical protein VD794_12335, partial [Flavisolibacter sp.]|nr:hypothetical protein [Flavisolibacter sp.]
QGKGLLCYWPLPDPSGFWLSVSGVCYQMLYLCELQKSQARVHHLDYEAGSIESLLKITELNKGITIIPELATLDFSTNKAHKLRSFKPPVPVRQIGLVTYRHFIKKKLLDVLEQAIVESVKKHINLTKGKEQVVPAYTVG